MTDFYQNYLTDKSFQLLVELKKQIDFILIGGWAVYFYTQALKSKDIDIIVDFSQLKKIKENYLLEKNERLKKYQVKIEEIDVDIYLPFYSDLGIPIDKIIKETVIINGFRLPKKEILLITKIQAYKNRQTSIKGQKDLIDIISLVLSDDFNFQDLVQFLGKNKTETLKLLKSLIEETKEVGELGLNQHVFAKTKKKILEKIKHFTTQTKTTLMP